MLGELQHETVGVDVRDPELLREPVGEMRPAQQRLRKEVEEQAALDVQLREAANRRAQAGALQVLQAAGSPGRGEQRIGRVQRGVGRTPREGLESNRLAGRPVQDRLEKRMDLLLLDQCADVAGHPPRLGNVMFLTL